MTPEDLALVPRPRLDAFRTDFEQAIQRLRGVFTDLLASVGADPSVPQAVARRFGVNKNLAWKVSKIVHATTGAEALPHVPGPAGIEILLGALAEGGAQAEVLERARTAVAGFDTMVQRHAGDRASLELMIASSNPMASGNSVQETGRRLSFQGNSATWGVQAKARYASQFVAPNSDDADWLDTASFTGFVGFRRLRETASWPLVFDVSYNDDDTPRAKRSEPIDPGAVSPEGLPFLGDFSSLPASAIRAVPLPRGTLYELTEGPVGNTASFSITLGWRSRAFARKHRDERNRYGEHHAPQNTPVELVQFDLFMHRSLEFATPPELQVHSLMQLGAELPVSARRRFALPQEEHVQDLGSGPPVVASPHVPNYASMVATTFERMQWNPAEFRGFRLLLRYPPIPSIAVLRYPLLDPLGPLDPAARNSVPAGLDR